MNDEWEYMVIKVLRDLKKLLSRKMSGGSGTPREPSSDRLDPVPDVVPEHEKHKPRIISN